MVEHIVYESQPGFIVTSSMFIPAGVKKSSKAPVVIYCSGHSDEGYRVETYQQVILNLVKKGFIVFAFDPIGQGERLEYYNPKSKKSIVDGPTIEHSYPGTQAFITGSSLARYMVWDGIRAVDYLLTRNEVDPARIGIIGHSGGGTQSAYIGAMDARIYAAAPECYITNFTRLFQSIGNQDAEQNLYNGIIRGIDHADLLMVRSPKPALMITTTGQVSTAHGGETVFSLNCRETENLVNKLQASRNDLTRHLSRILNSAKKLSGYQEPSEINEPAFTGRSQREGYAIEQYLVKGEGDYIIPYLLLIPAKPGNKALIYLHPHGKSAEATVGGEMEWFVHNGFTVIAPDMIGVGETSPVAFEGDACIEGVSHNLWYASMLIGRSIVGISAGDVVRLIGLLKENLVIKEVYGIARKEMAPVLLHAAAFDTTITRIGLIEPYKKADRQLNIVSLEPPEKLNDIFMEWIK